MQERQHALRQVDVEVLRARSQAALSGAAQVLDVHRAARLLALRQELGLPVAPQEASEVRTIRAEAERARARGSGSGSGRHFAVVL